jgi:hypothetical protein
MKTLETEITKPRSQFRLLPRVIRTKKKKTAAYKTDSVMFALEARSNRKKPNKLLKTDLFLRK